MNVELFSFNSLSCSIRKIKLTLFFWVMGMSVQDRKQRGNKTVSGGSHGFKYGALLIQLVFVLLMFAKYLLMINGQRNCSFHEISMSYIYSSFTVNML